MPVPLACRYYEAESRLRERLIGLGYHEILTIPHVAEDRNELFRPADAAPAKLSNPLSEEAGVLKSTGAVTMASAIEWNLNHGQRNARLFEIGSHYRFADGKPVETRVLTIGATGAARPQALYDPPRDYSFADLKGDLDSLGALSGGLRWEQSGPDWLNPPDAVQSLWGKNLVPHWDLRGNLANVSRKNLNSARMFF